jgi:hypothetical protein
LQICKCFQGKWTNFKMIVIAENNQMSF